MSCAIGISFLAFVVSGASNETYVHTHRQVQEPKACVAYADKHSDRVTPHYVNLKGKRFMIMHHTCIRCIDFHGKTGHVLKSLEPKRKKLLRKISARKSHYALFIPRYEPRSKDRVIQALASDNFAPKHGDKWLDFMSDLSRFPGLGQSEETTQKTKTRLR